MMVMVVLVVTMLDQISILILDQMHSNTFLPESTVILLLQSVSHQTIETVTCHETDKNLSILSIIHRFTIQRKFIIGIL